MTMTVELPKVISQIKPARHKFISEGWWLSINSSKNCQSLPKVIPEKYLQELLNFIEGKKYGIISFVIQNGKVVGCDILEKKRDVS